MPLNRAADVSTSTCTPSVCSPAFHSTQPVLPCSDCPAAIYGLIRGPGIAARRLRQGTAQAAVANSGLRQNKLEAFAQLRSLAPFEARCLAQAYRAGCEANAGTSLGDGLVFIGLVGRNEIVNGVFAGSRAWIGGYGHRAWLRQDDLAPETVDAIARLDRHRGGAALAGDRESDTDAPAVQAAVVQPSQLTMRALQFGQVFRRQPLPVEERAALERGNLRFFGHAVIPPRART